MNYLVIKEYDTKNMYSTQNQTLLTSLLFETNLDGSIDFNNFSVIGYLPK